MDCHLPIHWSMVSAACRADRANQVMDNSRGNDNLFAVAVNFRDALIACPKQEFSEFLRCRLKIFPKQCCDVASLLLAYRLRDLGFQNIERCFGYLDGESHVWLQVNGWIIDITANQFPSVGDPVIVARIDHSPWHAKIRLQEREPAYSLPAVRGEYDRAYAWIKGWLGPNDPSKAGQSAPGPGRRPQSYQ